MINFETFTISGRIIDTSRLSVDDIDMKDIAMHLASLNRYHGALTQDFSVAEHSRLVAAIVRRECERTDQDHMKTRRLVLAALLHDAHEYITGDVIRPYKRAIDEHSSDLERRIDRVIGARFHCDPELFHHPAVKRADSLAWQAETLRFVHRDAWPAFESWGFDEKLALQRIQEGVTPDPKEFKHRSRLDRAYFWITCVKMVLPRTVTGVT